MDRIANGNGQAPLKRDWSRCESGPPERWPATLRLAVDILLDLPLPALIMWGPAQALFINAEYADLMGIDPSHVPGGSVPSMPPAPWSWNPSVIARVWGGQSLHFPTQTLTLWRDTGPAERNFDLSYTPLRDEESAVRGILCTMAPPSAPSATAELAPLDILVVEDNPDAQYLVCEMLRTFGHKVDAVARAEEALLRLRQEQFDVLFSDVSLPGMSGVDLARQALKEQPALRIVFASGYSQNLTSQLDFPAVSIQKPYDIEQLQQALAGVSS